MSYASILFFIFGFCVLLMGFYMYTGHKVEMLAWKAAFKHLTKNEWKNVGKWTMVSSIIIFLVAILLSIFNI